MRKTIYLAGGCFYGVQSYFEEVKGVTSTTCGYVNGTTAFPTHEDVLSGRADHLEAVKVDFEENIIRLQDILDHYLRIVDPCSAFKQGDYKGHCYGLGIYYNDVLDGITTVRYIDTHTRPGHYIDIRQFENFYPAEEKHQNYAKAHPFWKNSVNLSLLRSQEKKEKR